MLPVRLEVCDELAALAEPHLLRVGEHVGVVQDAAGPLALVHVRAHHQHRVIILLARIDPAGQLVVAEPVGHAVVADGVSGTEVRVGVVVRHTPGNAAGDPLPDRPVALDLGVAQGVGQPMELVVLVLGGEHVPVALGDQVPLIELLSHVLLLQEPVAGAVLGEVVVGVHVLQEVAVLQIPDAAGLP